MRQVRRYIESDNLILFVVLLEIERVVALVAIDNEQLYFSKSTLLYIGVKVL
jgi:hypothetical protein